MTRHGGTDTGRSEPGRGQASVPPCVTQALLQAGGHLHSSSALAAGDGQLWLVWQGALPGEEVREGV